MSLQWWRDTCREADPQMRRRAAERQDRLTKPRGSLGRLEQVAIDLAALQGRERPSLERLWVTVFAGDHERQHGEQHQPQQHALGGAVAQRR
ncbi:nicotinate-nucleotide--dimethylbenzimidazole phosphoribosyltransferase, partial [Pseudomonas aeruginosa]|uniref:nicotinate-nucleotide--dimethylbenzimidazole phosphoribosyltransferase n=1 Tax=Pseudomonas aeruginosa TaxID=287 RepID=UPI0020C87C30